jgi:hypothetical protein
MARVKALEKTMQKMLLGEINLHFNKEHPGGCLVVLSVLEKAQHGDELTKILNIKSVSRTLATTLVGITVMGKVGFSKASLTSVLETSLLLLDT